MSEPSYSRQAPVAVVGVGALLPGCDDVEDFWRAVLTGRDLIGDVPATHWLLEDYYDPDPSAVDKTYGRRGAFLRPTEFDTLSFGIPPKALPATDTTQLLSLVVVERLLADAFGGRTPPDRERVGVVLGTAAVELLYTMAARLQRPVWLKALRASGIAEPEARRICDRIADHYPEWQEESFPGLLGNVVAGRVANRFDFHGANFITDAACASSLAAISTAVDQLALGRADVVITGGADTANDILMYMCFSKTPAMSPSGDCRPFSDLADGTVLGEGLVFFALKRLADAERDGDRVYGVIKGVGSSSDGKGAAVYTPVPQGQERALRRAYQAAGYGPDTVELVEAHGTGTKAGDAAEVAALREVFGPRAAGEPPRTALGSVKSQLGHLKSAAGAVGLLKALLALNQGVLPPTAKVRRPNPDLLLEGSPLYLNTAARPWVRGRGHPRRASVSSFGFGGSNFHLTVEEYVPAPGSAARRAPRFRALPAELVPLSAAGPVELLARLDALVAGPGGTAAKAKAAQGEFRAGDRHRLALVVRDAEDLARQAASVRGAIESHPAQPFATPGGAHYAVGDADPGALCLLFPGQGGQYPGMGGDVAAHLPRALAAWDAAASVDPDGWAPHRVAHPAPAFTDEERAAQQELLTATEWAQPALAVHSLALLEVLRSVGVRPDLVAGHSLGELVALHAAGVFDAPDLVRLARRRGELMGAVRGEPGAMLAVAAAVGRVEELLAESGADGVWVANHNGPEQVVVSGVADRVEALRGWLEQRGVRTRRLPVSHAFHTPLVADAGEPLLDFLHTVPVRSPLIPVVGNRDAAAYPDEPDAIRHALAAQVGAPVRFAEQVEELYRRGARTFVEVGAGSALTGLVSATLGDRPHLAVSTEPRRGDGVTGLSEALGRLAVAGVPVDFAGLWESYDRAEAGAREEPAADNRAVVSLLGVNYGKPRPAEDGTAALAEPVPGPGSVLEPAEGEEASGTSAMPPAPTVPTAPRPVSAPPVSAPPVPSTTVPSAPVPPPSVPSVPAPSVAVPAPPSVPLGQSNGDSEWWRALHESQRETALAHAAYQRAMADNHTAFLRLSEVALTSLAAALNGNGHHAPAPTYAPPATAPRPDPPAAWPDAPPAAPPAVRTERSPAPPDLVEPPARPEPAPVAEGDAADLEEVLLSVVADRTGFPEEMLSGEMDLEADLGVDSIKRVEVLSALRERVPGLADVDTARLGRLRTLREIADLFRGVAPVPAPERGPRPPGPQDPEPPPPARLAWRTAPAPAPGLRMAGLSDGPVLVTPGEPGVAEALAARLAERGVPAEAVPAEAVPAEAVPAEAVSAGTGSDGTGSALPSDARAVVFLGGLREVASPDEAFAVQREAFRLTRDLAPRFARDGGLLVTVQDTGGDFGLRGAHPERAWLGGIAALARTAAVEWPDASVKAVDCERGGRSADALAQALAAELLTGGAAPEVGLRADGTRTAPVLVPVPAPPPTEHDDLIRPDSVLVVSGGARGITARALVELAARHRPRLVLLGRTPPAEEPEALRAHVDEPSLTRALMARERDRTGRPPTPAEAAALAARVLAGRELRRTLEELRGHGSEVRYACVDVRDPTALAAALAAVRAEWGPVTGVVHAAGVLADRRLEDKTDEQFDRVFGTKADGLRGLLAATADDPLELVCVFSSVAAVHGNAGQCDYAMANEVLAHVASAERAAHPARRVRSIAWGPWRGGMVSPGLAHEFDRRGVPLLDPDAGARAFVAELSADSPDVRVVVAGAGDGAPHGAPPRRAAEVLVDAASHGHLADHAIVGVPVLPLAVVLEWFRAVAATWWPGGDAVVLGDVQVLRKAALPDFATTGHRLAVRGVRRAVDARPVVELELCGDGGVVHYRAVASVGEAPDPRPWHRPDGEPLDADDLYDGVVLFHGPAFQVLRGGPVVAADAAAGVVDGLRAKGWPAGLWHTDPVAVDGALQLAGLWAARRLAGAWLPMSVGRFAVGRSGPLTAPAEVVVRVGRVEHDTARCDIRVQDGGGAVAELTDVVLVRRPDVPADRVPAAPAGEVAVWRGASR
ncbi:type I polyketide synthase [Saccharothrix australiensis]|uniref:Polyketide-type polyunsaturated fatty acid synthase PfaA n=1 Tax=Saccharothrix australiensis TaxID=2072 RepID=A0A495VYL0_9PSEU|nr:type I polyketide synthase [Saccharothrix australiensis]RKT54502.1 polyketide-type polyunsaturated fatty acid synthase PfaA [Saccharothrix australiensis]